MRLKWIVCFETALLLSISGFFGGARLSAQITGANVILSPTVATFIYAKGGSLPGSQSINISSMGGALSFEASTFTTSGGGWLTASPANGIASDTPSLIILSLNPEVVTTLPIGEYSGTLRVDGGIAAQFVSVTLYVQANLATNPTTLTFTAQQGDSLPPAQQVMMSLAPGGDPPVPMKIYEQIPSGFLSIALSSTLSNSPITIGVTNTNLPAGTYTSSVIFDGW